MVMVTFIFLYLTAYSSDISCNPCPRGTNVMLSASWDMGDYVPHSDRNWSHGKSLPPWSL